jgi:hypothetical protein
MLDRRRRAVLLQSRHLLLARVRDFLDLASSVAPHNFDLH